MAPVNRERNELSASEKFAIKQGSNLGAKILGDAITARGVYTLANPTAEITTQITGSYVKQGTITANEAALSMQREKLDRASAKQRNVDLKVKGSPGKGKRYRSTTQFVRADRTARGKIRITPKGRDYLHSIETTPEREKRLAKSRRRSKATIIGGRVLRYGVPVLMGGWTVYEIIAGKSVTQIVMETTFMDLEPLPEGDKQNKSMWSYKPIFAHAKILPDSWSELFG